MNKNLLFSILALTACAFADGDTTNSAALANEDLIADNCNPKPECKPKPPECKPKPPPCKPKPKPCEPCVRKAMQPIVLTSSRPCNDAGVYIFADALYWHADLGNSDWAFVNNGTTPGITGSNEDNTFSWDWGFRVGLGYDFDHDQWDTDIYYTWFRSNSNNGSDDDDDTDADDSSGSVASTAFSNSLDSNYAGTFTTGSASSKLNFNVLDWELGRWFYVSNSVSLRPHVGLKGSWITLTTGESLTGGLSLTGTSTYTVSNSTKAWAIGPSGGINTNWYFGTGNTHDMRDGHRNEVRSRPHFSIFGDFAGALMFSHFKNSHTESGTTVAGVVVSGFNPTNLNRNQVVPVLQSIVGLAFDTCLSCDKMHLGIRVGYEFQWWFRESQRLYVNAPSTTTPRYIRSSDDLALQGLTVDVRFDF
jgi:hypothetical protein